MKKRKCNECPAKVQAVCRHAFGRYWNAKSGGGEGCDAPMDDVAKAWYAQGWKPGAIGVSIDLPKMPRRPVRRLRQGQFDLEAKS